MLPERGGDGLRGGFWPGAPEGAAEAQTDEENGPFGGGEGQPYAGEGQQGGQQQGGGHDGHKAPEQGEPEGAAGVLRRPRKEAVIRFSPAKGKPRK